METVRVDLGDGNWCEIKRYLTRGDRRRIDEYIQEKAFAYLDKLKITGLDINQLRDMAGPRDGAGPPMLMKTISCSW